VSNYNVDEIAQNCALLSSNEVGLDLLRNSILK